MQSGRLPACSLAVLMFACLAAGAAHAQSEKKEPYWPMAGQAGKDVVWVPTPEVLVEKMLDMAAITPQDYVMDLGSGDGRMVIAAAKRGARALGVEYNPKMIELSNQLAEEAGVADLANFVEGDMYEADISQATVLALFLLPENLDRLAPKFLEMKPGVRIVLNGFTVSGWVPDATERVTNCDTWCTAYLYYVPAKVAGEWRLTLGEREGELSLLQHFQMVRGSLSLNGRNIPVENGRLFGDRIEFTAAGTRYSGSVNGEEILGLDGKDGVWTAVRHKRD